MTARKKFWQEVSRSPYTNGGVRIEEVYPRHSGTDEVSTVTCLECWAEAGCLGVCVTYTWDETRKGSAQGWWKTGVCLSCGHILEPEFIPAPLYYAIWTQAPVWSNEDPRWKMYPRGMAEIRGLDEEGCLSSSIAYLRGNSNKEEYANWLLLLYREGHTFTAIVSPHPESWQNQ